jgi:hypothetical protein
MKQSAKNGGEMRRKAVELAATVAAAILLSTGIAAACGDKFVMLGRGMKTEMGRARHPASILLFNNPSSRLPAAEREYGLAATLKAAGHKPLVLQDRVQLEEALISRGYDLVMADFADVPSLEQSVRKSAPDVVVIPVLYKPSGAELAEAQRQYGCLLKASNKHNDLLTVIDEVMGSRAKGVAANCPKAK